MATLQKTKTFSSFSARNMDEAKSFYEQTLGLRLEQDQEMGGMLILNLDGCDLIIYPKDDHQPATFTVLNFKVDDIEAAVDDLTRKGVRFEQYGGDIQTDAKGICRSDQGPSAIAWFKDPAGNILSLIEE